MELRRARDCMRFMLCGRCAAYMYVCMYAAVENGNVQGIKVLWRRGLRVQLSWTVGLKAVRKDSGICIFLLYFL